LISVHHRLGNMTGHRYPEALGLIAVAAARHMDFVLLINENANTEVRAALPVAQAVLHCPVFRKDLSFDERTADFVEMLHRHLDPVVCRSDRVLVTTATQCEVRALARWLAETPANRRPWVLAVIHSDRWNRYGPDERERQVAEFRIVASELARLDGGAAHRLLVGGLTDDLCGELSGLLGITVHRVPQTMPSDGYIPPRERPVGEPALVGVFGGARYEKGSHLISAIISESRKLGAIDFVVQLANEDLAAAAFADLCRTMQELGNRAPQGQLDQATYRSLFARCDVVLLPYERIPYRKRASGIFVEATLIGRPAVVPDGTWMGDQVVAGTAAGVAYEGDDPAAIATVLMRAVDALPGLAALAKRQAPYWQRTMTLDVFVDWLEGEISTRSRGQARTLGRFARDLLDGLSLARGHRRNGVRDGDRQ
jgi:hypothetical protein